MNDTAQTAVYFSSASRNFNGSFADDYSNGFAAAVKALYRANIAANVICRMPDDASKIKVLLLTDCDCLSDEERTAVDKYMASGGTVITVGLCGARDAGGADVESGSYLKKFGIEPLRPNVDRTLNEEARRTFFHYRFFGLNGTSPHSVEYKSDRELTFDENNFCKLTDNLYWSPIRPQAEGQAEKIAALVGTLTSQPLNIKVPDSLQYRVYTNKDGEYIVHFIPIGVTANYHPSVRLHKTGHQIVESLNYEPLCGQIVISWKNRIVKLYSADLDEVKIYEAANGITIIPLNGISRFFSIKLEN